MKVIELLEENYFICHNKDVLFKEVHSIKTFHEEVEEGDIFIALRGENFDGNDFIWQAYERGAVCVISDEEGKGDIEVKNARQTYSLLSKNFFDKACDKLKIIAITGTNGKTTTCNIVADLLRSFGKKVGVIGTLGVKIDGDFEYNGFTTPDPFLLHKTFFKMAQMGLEYVVMEASAHAIYLDKLDYIKFEIVAFTNFTQDHLDYFGDMKRYFQAKLKIFNKNNVKLAIVANKIDKIDKILKQKGVKYLTFGLNGDCDYKGEIIENSLLGSHFICQNGDKVFDIKSNFIGSFNVENLLCGFAICHNLALDERLLTKNISSLMPPLGRCNILKATVTRQAFDYGQNCKRKGKYGDTDK